MSSSLEAVIILETALDVHLSGKILDNTFYVGFTHSQRTTAVYPHKAAADAHTTYCTVSGTIASLLEQCPSLVSVAVNTFCLPPAAGSNKNYIAAMTKFGEFICDSPWSPSVVIQRAASVQLFTSILIRSTMYPTSRV